MAHEAGKGSRPRPFNVTQEQYDSRWDAIFGRDLKDTEEKVSDDVLATYNDERLVSKFDKETGVSGSTTQK